MSTLPLFPQFTRARSEGQSRIWRIASPNAIELPVDNEAAHVDLFRCRQFATAVSNLITLRSDKDPFCLKHATSRDQVRALVYMVGICDRLNWDFVLGPLCLRLWEGTNEFDRTKLHQMSWRQLKTCFDGYRRSDGSIAYSAKLETLQALGQAEAVKPFADDFLETDLVGGPSGLLKRIRRLPEYDRDPIAKKANALLHELLRRKLVHVSDPDSVQPAIDYHIMRLHLRTGLVVLRHPDAERRLRARAPVRIETTTRIRRAVANALQFTAWQASVGVSLLNDLEWAFARRWCRRDSAVCSKDASECAFSGICASAGRPTSEMLVEPTSKHGFY